jgi:hypothetical protein
MHRFKTVKKCFRSTLGKHEIMHPKDIPEKVKFKDINKIKNSIRFTF